MTLNEITSTIRNRVADALSGNISNQAFSLEQLEEEVDLERSSIVYKYSTSNIKLNPNFLYQTVDRLKVNCINLSDGGGGLPCGIIIPNSSVPATKIPPISATVLNDAVEYFGLMNKQEKFIVYFDTDSMLNHKYRVKTSKKPFIWIDTTIDSNGDMTAYLLNTDQYFNLKFMSIRAIFEHPSRVNRDEAGYGDREYPAPGHIQNSIIDSLTEKYVRYFRQMNIPPLPNTQSDPVT